LIVQRGRFFLNATRETLVLPIPFYKWNSYTVVTGDAQIYNREVDAEGYNFCTGINQRTNKSINFSIADKEREVHWIAIGI